MAERNSTFWNSVELNAPSSSQWCREEKDFGMGGCLNNVLERSVVCNLVVVVPLLDGFIYRIGKGFTNKLARSKLTGMQQLPHQCSSPDKFLYGLFAVMLVLLLLFQEGKNKEYYYNLSKSRCNSKDNSSLSSLSDL